MYLYEVRRHISSILGKKYVIPLLGVWNSIDEIDWDGLPEKFVLKCTHDSGGIIVCTSKEELDVKSIKRKLKYFMKNNYFDYLWEWPYKDIRPRIIAEKFLTDGSGDDGKQFRDY